MRSFLIMMGLLSFSVGYLNTAFANTTANHTIDNTKNYDINTHLTMTKKGDFYFLTHKKSGQILDDKPHAHPHIFFFEDRATVERDGKKGYIDTQGNLITPIIYDAAYSFKDGFANVVQNNKTGMINRTGKVIIPLQYDYLSAEFSDGLAIFEKDGFKGYINKQAKEIVPARYDKAYYFNEGLAKVCNLDYCGFINKKGREVIALQYPYAGFYHRVDDKKLIASVSKDESFFTTGFSRKYGAINAKNEVVIDYLYDNAISFYQGFAPVSKDGKYTFLNADFKEVIAPKYSQLTHFTDGIAVYSMTYKNSENKFEEKFGLIDNTGKEITPASYDKIVPNTTVATYFDAEKDGKNIYLDRKGIEYTKLPEVNTTKPKPTKKKT